MPVDLVADENVDFRIVKALRSKGFQIVSILQNYRGLPDKQVLEVAKQHDAVLLTEDKDFGEWFLPTGKERAALYF